MSCSFKITNPSLFNTIKSPDPKIHFPTINAKNPSHKVRINVYTAPAINFESTICVREIGFAAIIRIVPIAASPEIKSPVTKETKSGICTINI